MSSRRGWLYSVALMLIVKWRSLCILSSGILLSLAHSLQSSSRESGKTWSGRAGVRAPLGVLPQRLPGQPKGWTRTAGPCRCPGGNFGFTGLNSEYDRDYRTSTSWFFDQIVHGSNTKNPYRVPRRKFQMIPGPVPVITKLLQPLL